MMKLFWKKVVSERILPVFVLVIMSIGISADLVYAESVFTDVSREHWAYDYIYSMANAGVINGYPDESFKPEDFVTRAEFCKMTILAAGIIPGENNDKNQVMSAYIDNEHWANQYMKSMFCYTQNYGEWYLLSDVQPDVYINRAEVATGVCEIVDNISESIADIDEMNQALSEKYSDYAQFGRDTKSIYFATQKGFMNGYPDGTFKPNDFVTRAEMCAVLCKAFSKNSDGSISLRADAMAKYLNDENVNTIIDVRCTEGSNATVKMFEKSTLSEKNVWSEILKCDAYIGQNGLGKTTEGDWKTPIGDFGIIEAFGIKPNPGTKLPYVDITESIYCCGDENYYNQIIDLNEYPHQCVDGEHMIEYSPHYNYGFFVDYNKECIIGKGSAIFFHCIASNPYTGGCIAVSEDNMVKILNAVDENTRIIIDYFRK